MSRSIGASLTPTPIPEQPNQTRRQLVAPVCEAKRVGVYSKAIITSVAARELMGARESTIP